MDKHHVRIRSISQFPAAEAPHANNSDAGGQRSPGARFNFTNRGLQTGFNHHVGNRANRRAHLIDTELAQHIANAGAQEFAATQTADRHDGGIGVLLASHNRGGLAQQNVRLCWC